MTERLKRLKSKSVFAFLLVCLLSLALAFTVACGDDKDGIDEGKFTKTETDTQLITNGNFEFGVSSMNIVDYPDTTVGNWSIAVDGGATSSKVSSGVIKTTDEAFNETINKLYEDSDFRNWALKYYFNVDNTGGLKDQAKEVLGNDASSTDVNEWVKKTVVDRVMGNDTDYNSSTEGAGKVFYKNPSVATETASGEKHVLMLNNFLTASESSNYYGFGTAQKATSSKTLTLTNGKYGKISVSVNTAYLSSKTSNSFGANIRVIPTVGGITQDEYRISNINTNGEWETYVIYVNPNEYANSTIKVVLGLGYGNGANFFDYAVEGTAYFDNVAFEELTASEYATEVGNTFDYDFTSLNLKSATSSERVEGTTLTLNNTNSALFSLATKDSGVNYFNELDVQNLNINGNYTTSSTGIKGNKFNTTDTLSKATKVDVIDEFDGVNGTDGIKITANKTSYEVVLKSNGFKVNNQEFMQISFFLKANLDKFDKSGLSLYVYDTKTEGVFNPSTDKYTLTVNNAKDTEWTEYSLILKNNFVDGQPKNFYLALYLGPTDVANNNDPTNYPTGSVTLAGFRYATGKVQIEETDTADVKDKYDIYFLNNKSVDNAKTFATALYANNSVDYTEETDKNTVFSFSVAPSDNGTITHSPANVVGFTGVSSNHKYINDENTETATNTNKDAGLINSKYFGAYSYANLETNLGFETGDDEIQPLMIYNDTASSYGFISAPKTIGADSYSAIRVKVKVVGDATAFVYLTEVADANKLTVLNQKFTADNGKAYSTDLFFEVTSDMCEDGFVELSFYVATGATAKDIKIELWNGSRDGAKTSQGFVFFDSLVVSTFSEGNFETSGTPLYQAFIDGVIEDTDAVYFTRKLTDAEKEYNEQVEEALQFVYYPTAVLASDFDYELVEGYYAPKSHNGTFLYAIFNTIDPTEKEIPEVDTNEDSGCTTDYDPSTFWLSFSSILLAVALLVALIAVIVKAYRIRRKKNKNDAKSHYKVVSRNKVASAKKKTVSFADFDEGTEEVVEENIEEPVEEVVEEVVEEPTEDTETEEEYTYGEVLEDFSDDDK